MLKELHARNKRIITSALLVSIVLFSQVSTSAFASSTTQKQSHSSITNGLKLGNIDTGAEQDFLSRTNSLRASLGIGPLKVNYELLAKARNWSQTQANAGTIFHSTLTDGVTQNWQSLGENVGMGPDVLSIHNALVASPRHYQNLVDPRFTEVGIGVISQDGTIYVSQVFMQFMPEQVAETPATTQPASNASTTPQSGGKKSVGATQGVTTTTPAPVDETPIAEAAPFETASQELIDVVAKLHELEN